MKHPRLRSLSDSEIARLTLKEALRRVSELGLSASIEGDTDTIFPDCSNIYFNRVEKVEKLKKPERAKQR